MIVKWSRWTFWFALGDISYIYTYILLASLRERANKQSSKDYQPGNNSGKSSETCARTRDPPICCSPSEFVRIRSRACLSDLEAIWDFYFALLRSPFPFIYVAFETSRKHATAILSGALPTSASLSVYMYNASSMHWRTIAFRSEFNLSNRQVERSVLLIPGITCRLRDLYHRSLRATSDENCTVANITRMEFEKIALPSNSSKDIIRVSFPGDAYLISDVVRSAGKRSPGVTSPINAAAIIY